ncbi:MULTISPECIES: hypothetical protein [unclassified Bradyrhizobium]|uniref:hypothetical protein n=1 Tax=unclassified Bradyrhizobium TaxID=2631580 RepID=UPI0028E721B0|nr:MULTISPECIES: hypothetical protein [unclassified Bradyrhizobium]
MEEKDAISKRGSADQKDYVAHLGRLLARAGRNDEQAFAELHAATILKMRKTVRRSAAEIRAIRSHADAIASAVV